MIHHRLGSGVLLLLIVTGLLLLPATARAEKPAPCPEAPPLPAGATGVPILWVHGLGGDCTTWDSSQQPPDALSSYFRYDNAGDFTDPYWLQQLDRAIGDLAAGSPTGQVDIVAHSMGGLLARYYLGRPEAQNAHRVRHLIMVGTPNRGFALAYGVRLSDMIRDPEFYEIPPELIRQGALLYSQYLAETTNLQLLWRRRPTFQRWLHENTGEWEIMAVLSGPISHRWERRNEGGERLPRTGATTVAPYTRGFERLAGILAGAYQTNSLGRKVLAPIPIVMPRPWLPDEPVSPLSEPIFWASKVFSAHQHSMAFDRLLPERIRFIVAVDEFGNQVIQEVPANPVLLRLNAGPTARRGGPDQQLTGVATVATDVLGEIGGSIANLAGRGVDPTLAIGPNDGVVETRSVHWGRLVGTDAYYQFDGPLHTDQGSHATVRDIIAHLRADRFDPLGVLRLADTPASGRRVMIPPISHRTAGVQEYRVEGPLAYEIRYDGEQKPLPLQLRLENPLYPVRVWVYAEYRDRPGRYAVREVIAPTLLQDLDLETFARYYLVTRDDDAPLTIEYRYGSQPEPAAAAAGAPTTLILFDSSYSMADAFQNMSKLAAAKYVAAQLVRLRSLSGGLAQPAAATPGLIDFYGKAHLLSRPGAPAAQLLEQIRSLAPGDGTNIGAAIELGLAALGASPEQPGELLLLTDGMPVSGLSAAEILDQLVPRALAAGVTIHTIGFGNPGEVDEAFLRELALRTGGQYTFARTPFALENQALSTYHQSGRLPAALFSGTLAAGEVQSLGRLPVPPGIASLEMTLNWPGSRMELVLRDPDGNRVDAEYPGATWSAMERPIHLRLRHPQPGEWSLAVVGSELPEGPEPFLVQVSAVPAGNRPGPAVPTAGIWFLLSGVAFAGGLARYLLAAPPATAPGQPRSAGR